MIPPADSAIMLNEMGRGLDLSLGPVAFLGESGRGEDSHLDAAERGGSCTSLMLNSAGLMFLLSKCK